MSSNTQAAIEARLYLSGRAQLLPIPAPFEPKTMNPLSRRIIRLAAGAAAIPVHELLGRSRADRLVKPRHAAMWLVRKHCQHLTFGQLAQVFNRHHTTVLYGIAMVDRSPDLYAHIFDAVEAQLKGDGS